MKSIPTTIITMDMASTIKQEWSLFVSGGISCLRTEMAGKSFSPGLVCTHVRRALNRHPVVGLCRRPACESLATKLGGPGGTLILTLAVTGIEVMMISAVMLTGKGNPSLARDAMFAVVMIALTGMIGFSLLLGGLRYHEQTYNLQGANAYPGGDYPPGTLHFLDAG